MISVEFSETEALALSIAVRAMLLAYDLADKSNMTEEAYTELAKAAEKLDQSLWGPVIPA